MDHIIPVLAAIIPGSAITFWIYKLDRYKKEPLKFLIACFIFGIVITYPALRLEEWAFHQGWDRGDHLGYLLLTAFIIVALNEELVKYLILRFFAYSKRLFDEPLDGIIYSIMIGMGFATMENVLYAFRVDFSTILVRALTAVPAHAVFAIFMGYYVGKAKFAKTSSAKVGLMFTGFALAVLVHGIYDLFIIQDINETLLLAAPVVLIVAGIFAIRLLRKAMKEAKESSIVDI